MPYYEYKIQVKDQDKREMAIALLSNLAVDGFEENEEELFAISTQIIEAEDLEVVMQLIHGTYSQSIVEEKNWNEKWESGFQPITVMLPGSSEAFVYVRAHFHPASPGVLHDLIITPKMSFGTGHHATTYGMMAYMSRINFIAASVVDFGTGTGVLAILAEKLGAKKILALDNDPGCISNAEENAGVNRCRHIELKQSDHFEALDKTDVILANINLNIIKSNLKSIANACSADTIILFSGILEQDEATMLETLQNFDISTIDIIKQDGWLVIAAKKSMSA